MTGAVVLKFKVKTWEQAVTEATRLWREVCERPDLDLPPLTHIDMEQDSSEYFDVVVRLDIDRLQVEKAQGDGTG